jgi:tRNA-dihydrouridine synthase A
MSDPASPWRFCVAPMMDWTDSPCRVFHRGLSRRARLYTEMVTTGAIIHGPRDRLLAFDPIEHPLALQLGGSDPAALAECARIGAERGYDEINLNCGCPSDRVQNGCFGAVLMRDPALVARCVAAMKAALAVPVTVKCRIGVDDQDPAEALFAFARAVFDAGADALIVHARKAWLQGLSPKDNRTIPPLDYPLVRRLKAAWPERPIVINGGVADLDAAAALLASNDDGPALDGVMLGRAAYQDPALLLGVDPVLFGAPAPAAGPMEAVLALRPAVEALRARGLRLHALTRHMVGLFNGLPGSRLYRQHLSTACVRPDADWTDLEAALSHVLRERHRAAA